MSRHRAWFRPEDYEHILKGRMGGVSDAADCPETRSAWGRLPRFDLSHLNGRCTAPCSRWPAVATWTQSGGQLSFAGARSNGEVAPIPAVRRHAGDLSGSGTTAVVQVQQRDGSS